MLSYQHGYHAGGFADVIKHITLTQILHYLVKKPKPLFYLETHSGKGRYDLKDKQALKTGEAQGGIELLWEQPNLPPVFSSYLQHIRELNKKTSLHYYPGSPSFALNALRPQDRQFLCELHPGEFELLQQLPHHNKRVFFSNSDGIQQLSAQLPPIERRGLIFIDPSYEIKTEYREVPQAIKAAYHRFKTGVYCLWYPLVDNKLHDQLIRGLKDIGADNNLNIEFYLTGKNLGGMTGCGLWIINPPYTLHNDLNTALNLLRKVFNPGVSSYRIEK
jgi:23S rRNA (adenine2030-N6)-methyltransferase